MSERVPMEALQPPLTLDEYQAGATQTAIYPGQGSFQGLTYAVLGLNGEAGETGEQVKKTWRDEGFDLQARMLEAADEVDRSLKQGNVAYQDILEHLRTAIADAFQQPLTEERRGKLLKELGDTLWYAAQLATELGVSLGDVAQQNLDKLAARKLADKIHGEGSDR